MVSSGPEKRIAGEVKPMFPDPQGNVFSNRPLILRVIARQLGVTITNISVTFGYITKSMPSGEEEVRVLLYS